MYNERYVQTKFHSRTPYYGYKKGFKETEMLGNIKTQAQKQGRIHLFLLLILRMRLKIIEAYRSAIINSYLGSQRKSLRNLVKTRILAKFLAMTDIARNKEIIFISTYDTSHITLSLSVGQALDTQLLVLYSPDSSLAYRQSDFRLYTHQT